MTIDPEYCAFRQKFPKLWTSVAHSFLQQIAQNKNWAHPKATTLPRICKVEMQQASLLYYSAKPQSGGILGCALVCPTSLYVRTIRFPIVRRPKWRKSSKTESCWYRRVNEQFLQKWLRKSKRNLVAKKARTYEWVIVTYGRFLVDRRAPRVTKATCTFWSQPKARETL